MPMYNVALIIAGINYFILIYFSDSFFVKKNARYTFSEYIAKAIDKSFMVPSSASPALFI